MYTMSDEQQKNLKESFNNLRTLTINFGKVMNQVFKETIKPMLDNIKTLLEDKNGKPKIKIKYKPILKITVNSYVGVNRPKMIRCRNNC